MRDAGLLLGLLTVILARTPALRAGEEAARDAEITFEEGVVFSRPDGVELALNCAVPAAGEGPLPVVLFIHGGGWRGGRREHYDAAIREYAAAGYCAVTTSYRLSDTRAWPAQLRDVRDSLAWIHANAERLRLDTKRIGVTGASAGGHLSLMLGLLPDARRGERRAVEAVVNYFGPTDLSRAGFFPEGSESLVAALAGAARAEGSEVYATMSPVTHVTPGDPPVLTFHGTADAIVPVQQARTLHAALEAAGIVARLELIEDAGHGWGGERAEAIAARTREFFDTYLRGSDLPLLAVEDFDEGLARWSTTDALVWATGSEGGESFLAMTSEASAYQPAVRSPTSIALLDGVEVTDFVFDVSLQYTFRDYNHASLCLFFGYQDPQHFYYVHFGKQADAHANSIFIVNGEPRVSIATTRTEGTDWDRAWHRARIRRDTGAGTIEVYFDDLETPVMTAEDKTFLRGRVGVGSFDDKGNFDTLRLRGRRR